MRKKRYKYAFALGQDAGKGSSSCFFAAASALLFVITAANAYLTKDGAGRLMGSLAVAALLFAVCSFVQGLSGFSDAQYTQKSSIIGTLSGGIMSVLWIGLFMAGI